MKHFAVIPLVSLIVPLKFSTFFGVTSLQLVYKSVNPGKNGVNL